VISMHMRFKRPFEPQSELLQQRGITVHLLEHRVDQHSLSAGSIGNKVGISR
jgi:hypothetical protein